MVTSPKIIITGPGRSGTTFLVMLLTRLGFDTGYEAYNEPYQKHWRAGCEWEVSFDAGWSDDYIRQQIDAQPCVLKGPEWSTALKYAATNDLMTVGHVFLPVRDLDVAAASRLSVGLDWMIEDDIEDYNLRLSTQANVMGVALGRAIEACLVCDLPYTLMTFPRIVEDADYCYGKLSEGLMINRDKFESVYKALANPAQVQKSYQIVVKQGELNGSA